MINAKTSPIEESNIPQKELVGQGKNTFDELLIQIKHTSLKWSLGDFRRYSSLIKGRGASGFGHPQKYSWSFRKWELVGMIGGGAGI